MNIYEDYKIYGPYHRGDGRQHVCLVHKTTGERKTVSYPKFLIECHLGRFLVENETVDHIDRDFTNNDLNNLRVIDRSEHASQDARRIKHVNVKCVFCGESFLLDGKISNRNRRNAGPFCSRSCAGKYGAALRNKQILELGIIQIEKEFFFREKG